MAVSPEFGVTLLKENINYADYTERCMLPWMAKRDITLISAPMVFVLTTAVCTQCEDRIKCRSVRYDTNELLNSIHREKEYRLESIAQR